jgi:hypothetical protein
MYRISEGGMELSNANINGLIDKFDIAVAVMVVAW